MKKTTSADESKVVMEGLFMKKPSGGNVSRLKSELNSLSKPQGQQSKLPVVPNPESPGMLQTVEEPSLVIFFLCRIMQCHSHIACVPLENRKLLV